MGKSRFGLESSVEPTVLITGDEDVVIESDVCCVLRTRYILRSLRASRKGMNPLAAAALQPHSRTKHGRIRKGEICV